MRCLLKQMHRPLNQVWCKVTGSQSRLCLVPAVCNRRPWLQTAGTKRNLSTPPKVCVSVAQLCHLSTISDFWELQRIIICRLINTFQTYRLVRSCNYHTRSLHHIRPHIGRKTAINLAFSIVASRLDYCNSVLYFISETNIAQLQWI